MLVRLIAAAAVLLYIEPRLAAVILPAGAVLALLATVFRRTLKRLHKQIQESDGRLRVYLQESLSSLLVVRIFDRRQAVSPGGGCPHGRPPRRPHAPGPASPTSAMWASAAPCTASCCSASSTAAAASSTAP